jgi:hypothetical protein
LFLSALHPCNVFKPYIRLVLAAAAQEGGERSPKDRFIGYERRAAASYRTPAVSTRENYTLSLEYYFIR